MTAPDPLNLATTADQPALELLLGVSRLLSDGDPGLALDRIAGALGDALNAAEVLICLLEEDQSLRVRGSYQGSIHPHGATIPWTSILGQRALWIDTPAPASPQFAEPGELLSRFPISRRGTGLGMLLVQFRTLEDFGHHPHHQLCQTIANQLATALAGSRPASPPAERSADKALVRVILNGGGLTGLAAELETMLDNPVIVSNTMFHHLAMSPGQDRTDRHRQESLVQGGTVREVLDDPRVRNEFRSVAEQRKPVILGLFPQHGWVQRRMQAPIFAGEELVGRVTVCESNHPFTDGDLMLLQNATDALALEFVHQRMALTTELRLRSDFLHDLFARPQGTPASLIARGELLGFDLLRAWIPFVVTIDDLAGAKLDYEEGDGQRLRTRVFEAISRAARQHDPESIAIQQNDRVVVFLPARPLQIRQARQFAGALAKAPGRVSGKLTVSIGIGTVCRQIGDFPVSYQRANRALEIAAAMGQTNQIARLDEQGLSGLLFASDDREALPQFVERTIGRLLEHDRQRESGFVETLDAFFAENGNRRRTAERLQIHLNTLAGRLQRIGELGGIDLEDAEIRLHLQVALHAMRLTDYEP